MYPVQGVASMPKLKRENRGSGQQRPRPSKSGFLGILLEVTANNDCPEDCHTVTYDRQSRIQTYYYHRSKEYTL